ncbi:MAG: cell division protein FtsA [Alistipes sp.]|nr:cell division protein FtsA [Alistipes sp.]
MENGNYNVAIDLGTNTVVAVVGAKSEEGKIHVIDREIVPVEGMVRGEIRNIDQVSRSIKRCVEQIEQRQNFRITEASAGISGQHIRSVKQLYYVFASRGGEIRQEDVRQLHDSMRKVPAPDGERILQIIPQNYIVDDEEETSSPVGTFGNKLSSTFNIVLGDSLAINRMEMALSRAGVTPRGVYLNAIASADAVLSADEKQEGVAVVDIGAGTTDVVVYCGDVVRHVGIVPMGGNAINKDIRSYGILEKHVENLKIRYGNAMRSMAPSDMYITTPGLSSKASKEISAQNLSAIIEARMLDIFDFVVEELKKSECQDRLTAGVVLTGGGAQLKNIETLFKEYTHIEARVAGAECVLDEESVELAGMPTMATAMGLLVRACQEREPHRESRATSTPLRQAAPSAATETPEPRPVSARKINDLYRGGASNANEPAVDPTEEMEEESETTAAPAKRKFKFVSKMKEMINRVFDEEIEDNEI